MTASQVEECMKCIEFLWKFEPKHEKKIVDTPIFDQMTNEQQKNALWAELEDLVVLYQDLSPRHESVSAYVKKIIVSLIGKDKQSFEMEAQSKLKKDVTNNKLKTAERTEIAYNQ